MITFKLISITVILVMGWKIVTAPDMLLQSVGKFFENKVEQGKKRYQILVCHWCASSLFSVFAHLFAFGLFILPLSFNWQLLIRWPIVICASSFISGNLWNLYLTLNNIRDRNELEADYYHSLLKDK